MSLIKNVIPILEYDTSQKAIIMPDCGEGFQFPKKAVFPFLGDEISRYAAENSCEKLAEFESITKKYFVYKTIYKNQEICLCQAPMGAAAAVQLMDFLIGYGVKEIISAGSCGALVHIPENEFLVPTQALRDEGTSYHYLPPSRSINLHKQGIAAAIKALETRGLTYETCKTWTTDGFYRETEELVRYRIEEGYHVVEMECAALAACAQFRNVVYGQLLYTADSLADLEVHDERDWGHASMSPAMEVAMDAVINI